MSGTVHKETRRRFNIMPVTTMEEVPVLSTAERADFLASLREAEADLAAGNFMEHSAGSFRGWLMSLYRRV